MNELQRIPSNTGPQLPAPIGSMGAPPLQTIDVAAAGPKRDYAGLLEYWQMVRRHKAAVILMTCAGSLVGFLLTLSEPRVYQARTSLEIQGMNEEFLNMKSVSPVSDANGYADIEIQTQVKILQSSTLLNRVREKVAAERRPDNLQPANRLGVWRKALNLSPTTDDEIWDQAIGTAAGSVRVRASGTNRIVDVTCDSTHPLLAANFCNTLTKEYIDQNLESRWKSTEYTGQWLTKQLQDLKIKLEQQEGELQTYARSTDLVVTGEKNDGNETRLADLQKELSTAQADRFVKQSKYEMAASSPAGALPDVLDDPSLKDSQHALADLQARLAQLSVTFTPGHAEVRKVQVQIDAIEASLEGARANVLTRVRKDFEATQRREALLAAAYADQAHVVSSTAEENAHYGLLKRDVDATRMLYDTLQQRLKEASIASALRASNIRVVDAANRPGSPYKPDVSQRAMFGLMLGLVVGVTFAVMRERADRTIQDPGDVSYYLGLPELGVVPIGEMLAMPRAKGRATALALQSAGDGSSDRSGSGRERIEMISWDQKTSLLAESFRTTLTSILFSRRTGERPRVIVLTSASPKEGKTTVVSNLGIALAEINQKVLIIDADMRRPRLHNVFDLDNKVGLSDLLIQHAPLDMRALEDACTETTVPGMFVLPSGGSRRNVSSLLHSERLPELLALARKKFDTVIIDTPPMVNIADARVIARLGDGLIMVVRSGVTTRDAALLAKARFADDGITILGTILNFWNPKTPGYSYYRYYYAGYYHYYGDGSGKNGSGGADDGGESEAEEPRARSATWKPGFAFGPQLREDSASHRGDL